MGGGPVTPAVTGLVSMLVGALLGGYSVWRHMAVSADRRRPWETHLRRIVWEQGYAAALIERGVER